MPRFPDSDSFPTAREFVASYVRGELTFRDLRVVLFWLGFGLLAEPSSEDPTMSLVPLCKDLHTYADTALELGYDPTSSVHGHPVPLFQLGASCGNIEHHAALKYGAVPASSSSHSSSSSSAGLAFAGAAAATDGILDVAAPFPPRRVVKQAWRGVHHPHVEPVGQAAAPSGLWSLDEDEAQQDSMSLSPKASMHAGSYEDDAASNAAPSSYNGASMAGGATSSLGQEFVVDGASNATYEDSAADALAYKVKLLHAGGWSSDSASDGSGTPPVPAGSSSGNAAASSSGGGLDLGHVEQFTVTFVPDLQWHEDVEEDIACPCTFCLEDMRIGEQLCRLPCMHTFHRRCVHAWLERDRRCMLCRMDITRPCG